MKLDMLLVHAPSVYDFRERDDILFAYLSNSDSVHVSPIFEMPPVGIFALQQHLTRAGHRVEFFNVASQMLRDPELDVAECFRRVEAPLIGLDLHWLAHAHGALELARLYKEIHPGARAVLGGIASTYYHEELITYPQIDYVIRGYDTLLPLERLVAAGGDPAALAEVPNLTWKADGAPRINPLSHAPRTYSAAVDWSQVFTGDRQAMTPYNLVIPQAGCEYSCNWCGGSRYFFKKYMGLEKGASRVHKATAALKAELQSIADAEIKRHTITMIDFWHEYPELFDAAQDVFVDEKVHCVHYSLHRLPTVEKGARMAAPVRAVIELSPDSHDDEVAKASGRGKYTMAQMEAFMDALIDQVYSFEIYFMLGLPKQTADNIRATVEYCGHLLEKYKGRSVVPFVCPMLPFLDPGSEIFEHPEKWGYRLFHRTFEEHRTALLSLNWRDRLNYETEWLSREELVDVSYEAVRRLAELKEQHGLLPKAFTREVIRLIDETRVLLADLAAWQTLPEGPDKAAREAELRGRVRAYNRDQLKMVRSQQRPIDLGFTRQQWFDTAEAFARVMGAAP